MVNTVLGVEPYDFLSMVSSAVCEPITPFRLAIYLLTKAIDVYHRQKELTTKQLTLLSAALYSLISQLNLSFREFIESVEDIIISVSPDLYKAFLKRVDTHRGDFEVIIRPEEIFSIPKRSERNVTPFIYPKSYIGVFLRKLAITRTRQSLSEIQQTHKEWKRWLTGYNPEIHGLQAPSTSNSLLYIVTGDPTFLNGQAKMDMQCAVSPIKDRATRMSEKMVLTVLSPRSMQKQLDHKKPPPGARNLFGFFKKPLKSLFDVPQRSEENVELVGYLSSSRARCIISQQLHLLHVAPDEAMSADLLRSTCDFIRRNYLHLHLVHLVEMMNEIRCRNVRAAENALRSFFDWTTIRINETSGSASITADYRPLRYAPLLHARLARLFGQRDQAQFLLSEAIQQAQTNADMICIRLAFIEKVLLNSFENNDFVTSEPENSTFKQSSSSKFPTALLTALPTRDAALDEEDFTETSNEGKKYDEATKILINQLKDSILLIKCIDSALTCQDKQSLLNGLQHCVRVDYGIGRESQARMVIETAEVIKITLKLASGFTDEAITACHWLLHFNRGDEWCRKYDTEPQVIACVNTAYAYFIKGDLKAVSRQINHCKRRFTIENNWQCALHWKKCEAIVNFDRSFFHGEWKLAEKWLEIMGVIAAEEANLRKAVFFFTLGDRHKALELARSSSKFLKTRKDLRLCIRNEIVLAMLYASYNLHVSRSILDEQLRISSAYNLENFEAMIARRIAYIDIVEEKFESALAILCKYESVIKTRCSHLEKGLLEMTIFIALKSYFDVESNESLRFSTFNISNPTEANETMADLLLRAKEEFQSAQTPLLEKHALSELAKLYDNVKLNEQRDIFSNNYKCLDEKYPGDIAWTIL